MGRDPPINLSGAFYAIRAAVPGIKARHWGRIVNIASAHGLVASPFKSAYVAAKHGLVGLTKAAELQPGEHGIAANAVCPGYVWTPLVESRARRQAAAHRIPPEQVVREVLLIPAAHGPEKEPAIPAQALARHRPGQGRRCPAEPKQGDPHEIASNRRRSRACGNPRRPRRRTARRTRRLPAR